jgi:putative hydrolase of the HAD superfamily
MGDNFTYQSVACSTWNGPGKHPRCAGAAWTPRRRTATLPAGCGPRNANVITGVLLDVGHTIAFPTSGDWFIPPGFEAVIMRHGLQVPDGAALARGVKEGLAYLDANHRVRDEVGELDQFREFYMIVLAGGKPRDEGDGAAAELARTLVMTNQNFSLYPDVPAGLEAIRSMGLALGILSDNWPSLRRRLTTLGIAGYFTAIAISSEEGRGKPHESFYRTAADRMGLPMQELAFVDDYEENLDAGARLGMSCVWIQRDAPRPSPRYPRASSMAEVVDRLRSLGAGHA